MCTLLHQITGATPLIINYYYYYIYIAPSNHLCNAAFLLRMNPALELVEPIRPMAEGQTILLHLWLPYFHLGIGIEQVDVRQQLHSIRDRVLQIECHAHDVARHEHYIALGLIAFPEVLLLQPCNETFVYYLSMK